MRTPLLRNALHAATAAHLLPRAYLWGLADTLHVGVEGRPTMVRAFGHDYIDKAPAWVALAFLLVKVPLPFLALALAGIALLALRLLPRMTALPLTVFVAMLIFFMAFIAKNGVFYAGVRHWLFAIPLLAVPAAVCLAWCVSQRQRWLHAVPAVALLLIAVPVLPQRRIWEYHNVLAGGSYNAWKNFDNESVDLGQRSDELMTYFQQHISPAEPFWAYWSLRQQETLAGLHPWRPTPEQVADGHLTGWFVFRMSGLADRNWQNIEVFRDVQPTSRIGNAAIYRGTFYLPKVAGGILIGEGMHELDVQNGDMVKAELYLKRGVAMNPETPNALIELGNFALRRKDKPEALRLYRAAVVAEKDSAQVRQLIAEHIALVEQHPIGEVAAMRRPSLE